MNNKADNRAFLVGEWLVDPSLGRISRDAEEIHLEPKAMDVLVYLARRPGELVTRMELEDAVWAGTIVSYEALSVTINKIRKAVHDNSRNSQYIETLSKKGYRLVAPVSFPDDSDSQKTVDTPPDPVPVDTVSLAQKRSRMFVFGAALLLIAGVASYLAYQDHNSVITTALNRAETSIAVMPFSNISGDPGQDYLAYGLTEDVTTDLSRLSRLLVISRSSMMGYVGSNVPAQQVGTDMGVNFVLTGSVRRSDDRVRISTQLIDVSNNLQVWAERFDRKITEYVQTQDEITRKIVAALVVRLSDEEQVIISKRYTQNLEAHDYYMRGRALYGSITKEGNNLARQMFYKAIHLDPDFANAYAAIALTYVDDFRRKWGGDPAHAAERALSVAKKAVGLDNKDAVAHMVLAYVYLYGKLNPEQAIKSAQEAILIDPNYADAYAIMASAYSYSNRSDDAIRLNQYAMRLNPTTSVIYYANLGRDYYFTDRLPDAAKNLKEAIKRNYNYLNAHLYLAATFARMDNMEDAKWETEAVRSLDPKFSLAYWAKTQPYQSKKRLDYMVAGMRKAGLPE